MDQCIFSVAFCLLYFLLPLPPPLLAFSSAHYLPNLLPHMQTMCNESLSYLFSTNNSNSDMISIHILEATHDNSENQCLERLSCHSIPHFEALTLISWTKEEESLSWQEICHSGWFLVRNINFVVSVLKLLVSNGNFSDDWASSCKTKPIIALKLLVHCFIQHSVRYDTSKRHFQLVFSQQWKWFINDSQIALRLSSKKLQSLATYR